MPFTERAYYPPAAGGAGGGAGQAPFPAFQFRGRHESPDWRRLSAVDVGRVSREGDVAALQEHLEHVTFCSAERERCPHCQGPADPLLLKLLRLSQLCTEYLLHSQEYLSAQLGSLEQALRAAQAQRDQLGKEVAHHSQEIKGLKEECRRRKKMISTQQMMLEARASYHQCQFCEKAFMNYSFLQSHMQRRHPEESQMEQKRQAKTDKLQDEIDKLKEQLQLTKSQLEAEQQANMARFSKECEQQKSKEEEILQSFHKWKEDEKEKLADKIEKVKEMFMKELKELSSRNSTLENQLLELQKSNMQQKSNLGTLKDSQEFTEEKPQSSQDYHSVLKLLEKQESKWTSRIQALHHDHETEKSLLLSQIDKLKSSVREDLNKNNTFYKRRIEELGQRLQEQNDLIITQKKQIKELSTRSVASIKPHDVSTTVEPLEESKPSLPVMHEIDKNDYKTGRSNYYLINALKTDPSLTKELRVVLEQALEEKLESLGIKAGVRGIPNDRLNKILRAIESARECKQKQEPHIHRIREHLERQVSFRVEEKSSSCNRPVSCPQLPSEDKQKFNQLGILSSVTPQKTVKRSSTAVRPAEQRTAVAENTSTPKSRKLFGNGVSRKTSSITTPPFSSEEEADEDDIKQSHVSPELLQKQSKPSSSKVIAFQKASVKSDMDGTEESETEETGTPAKTSKGTVIQKLTEQVGKSLSNHANKNKPAGGINVAQAFIKKEEVKELKFTEADEDDWDISSVEDDFLLMKDDRSQKALTVQKNESNAASVVHAWGLPKTSVPKEEGLHEADNTSTLKSSLVTVTDWSDSSDI
ncbi:cilium assembly protein DZIP1 [Falco biarmicus]|uniref:zinc finger protein DZIP1 n=1 Tax=Falco rusticolus TaxID=120794 RepID=UPI0018869A72|nr:zinc finger protein DZIP1 [Falco rusticolus]XP_055558936.1 cilium assembly protein DZIP1 [Falco cherrug]XP_055658749.1 cilium assembly protein DZIP1 [Falco peregrinus]XP_056185328.1 cilium assembly protein DZIP1 [Falco biarmicus]